MHLVQTCADCLADLGLVKLLCEVRPFLTFHRLQFGILSLAQFVHLLLPFDLSFRLTDGNFTPVRRPRPKQIVTVCFSRV